VSPESLPVLTAWEHFVAVIGFPVVVALYVLIRLERRLTEVRDAVRDLVQLAGGQRGSDRRDRPVP
jgi:hypothetical protein